MIRVNRELAGQILRFGVVGGGATITHMIAAITVHSLFSIEELLANLIGAMCGGVVSYIGHSQFTFGVNREHGFQVPRFVAMFLTALAISSSLTWIVCDLLDGPFVVAQILMVGVVPIATFLIMKLWVFTAGKRHESES